MRAWNSIILLLITAVLFSIFTWKDGLENQTMTTFDTPNNPVFNYFFPSVTICNYNVISRVRVYETAKKLNTVVNITLEHLVSKLQLLYFMLDTTYDQVIQSNLNELQDILEANNVDVANLLKYLTPNCKEIVERCLWKGRYASCEEIFDLIATKNGFCCSFNYFGLKLKNKSVVNVSPKKVSATGYLTALEIVINSASADYFVSKLPSFGHNVIMHFPYSIPDENAQTLLLPAQSCTLITVNPIQYRTDSNINSFNLDRSSMENNKRAGGPNFTKDEQHLLASLVFENKNINQNKNNYAEKV
ncbi:hypothetical protein FQA39_LY14609 [Lamprigera yunnana]|nr:hypothetical protein FQA39_LY14609 [Lamprigera yunnana]